MRPLRDGRSVRWRVGEEFEIVSDFLCRVRAKRFAAPERATTHYEYSLLSAIAGGTSGHRLLSSQIRH